MQAQTAAVIGRKWRWIVAAAVWHASATAAPADLQ